jgi:hypothetical protein
MFTVTGSPVKPFVEAVLARLQGDATLLALLDADPLVAVGKITGHISNDEPLNEPYIVLGRRGKFGEDAGAMQLAGSMVSLQIDVFSAHKGSSEASLIQSRIAVLLERQTLRVKGFEMVQASMTVEFEDVSPETDEDMPDSGTIYHGVQRVVAEIHETA